MNLLKNPTQSILEKFLDKSRQNGKTLDYVEPIKLIDDDLQQWMITQKLLDVPDGQIIHTLVNRGIDIRIALEELKAVSFDPSLKTNNLLIEELKKLQSQLTVTKTQLQNMELQLDFYHKLEHLSPNHGKIERRTNLSRQEFLEKYYAQNTPVIMTDILDSWPAMYLWTPEYFKQKYGHIDVEVQVNRNSNRRYEMEKAKHKKVMPLADYVDMVVTGGETNDYYMVATNENLFKEEFKEILNDMVAWPEYLDQSPESCKPYLSFGPPGTITPLHYDPLNLFLVQISGRKLIKMISPNQKHLVYNHASAYSEVDLENIDYEKYPRFQQVNLIQTILKPGEVLFLPVSWWHHVKALDISMSINLTNFIWPNDYNWQNDYQFQS